MWTLRYIYIYSIYIKVDLSQLYTYAKHLGSTHDRRNNITVTIQESCRGTESPWPSTVALQPSLATIPGLTKKARVFAPPLKERTPSSHLTTPLSYPPPPLAKNLNGYGKFGAVPEAKTCHGGGSPECAPCRASKMASTSAFAPTLALLLCAAWVLYRHIGSLI